MNHYWDKPKVPEKAAAPPPELDEFYLHVETGHSTAVENIMRQADRARQLHNEAKAKGQGLEPESFEFDFCGPIVSVAVVQSANDRSSYFTEAYAIVSFVNFLDLVRSDCWCRREHLEYWEADWMEKRQEMKSRCLPVDTYRSSQVRRDDDS
jgi:hypothetical protein